MCPATICIEFLYLFVFCHCICNKGENSYELLPPGQKSWQGLVSSELIWFRLTLYFEYWWRCGIGSCNRYD